MINSLIYNVVLGFWVNRVMIVYNKSDVQPVYGGQHGHSVAAYCRVCVTPGVRCAVCGWVCAVYTSAGMACGTRHVGYHSKEQEARNASACVGE